MAFIQHVKDPSADKDYSWDWSDWLTSPETISTSAWSSSPEGLTLHDGQVASGVASTFISGGMAGKKYTVTNRIVTNSTPARTDERSFVLLVQET